VGAVGDDRQIAVPEDLLDAFRLSIGIVLAGFKRDAWGDVDAAPGDLSGPIGVIDLALVDERVTVVVVYNIHDLTDDDVGMGLFVTEILVVIRVNDRNPFEVVCGVSQDLRWPVPSLAGHALCHFCGLGDAMDGKGAVVEGGVACDRCVAGLESVSDSHVLPVHTWVEQRQFG
jgi:hypothetical protein